MSRSQYLISALFPLLLLACGPSSTAGSGESDGGGNNETDARSGQIDAGIPGDASSCGAQTEEIPLRIINDPPDLLIVLDKSGSMMLGPGTNPFGTSKWSLMEDAIETITTTYDTNIRFGLTAFPTTDICGIVPGAQVSIAINNASAINSWMSSEGPDGNTPAHLALQNASDIYAGIPQNSAGQYVLFATDGAPNCGGSPVVPDTDSATETLAAVTALRNQGVNTFVLGFGSLFGLDSGLLEDAADAGGEPRPGNPNFYHANDAASLQQALLAIAGGIIPTTCSFALTSLPPDPEAVTVTVAGVPVPRDSGHNNGWDYHPDANTITLFGTACASVQEGETSVSFVFGCPGPVID